MSREVAAGRYGVVDSEDYFRSLNQEYWIGGPMDSGRETEYYDCLRNLADNIRSTADEIYEDLKQQIGIIRYLPREHRENMSKVLLGLHDICQITSSSDGRCDSCISILSLSDEDTRPKSGASDSEIEDAAKLVRDSSFMNQSDRMDTVCKAMPLCRKTHVSGRTTTALRKGESVYIGPSEAGQTGEISNFFLKT
ncbi:MAG: hypothetical protein LKJ86_05745 [Oscillibacter sp.]|nr:hypothetical protein [Oscillibacter sp.]